MKPYLAKTMSDRIYEQLENDILQGKYRPGEMLTEMRLVEELKVSRTPVREALHRLEQEHLVQMTEHGMTVRGVTSEDLEDILFIRCRLEGLAARFAAEAHDEEGLKRLKEIVERQERDVAERDADHATTGDDAFHREIGAISGHLLLADTLAPLHRKIFRYRRLSVTSPQRAAAMAVEHRAIYEAIAAGDGKRSEELTNLHMENASKSILKNEE